MTENTMLLNLWTWYSLLALCLILATLVIIFLTWLFNRRKQPTLKTIYYPDKDHAVIMVQLPDKRRYELMRVDGVSTMPELNKEGYRVRLSNAPVVLANLRKTLSSDHDG